MKPTKATAKATKAAMRDGGLVPRGVTLEAVRGERVLAALYWQAWEDFEAVAGQVMIALRELLGPRDVAWVVSVQARMASPMALGNAEVAWS